MKNKEEIIDVNDLSFESGSFKARYGIVYKDTNSLWSRIKPIFTGYLDQWYEDFEKPENSFRIKVGRWYYLKSLFRKDEDDE